MRPEQEESYLKRYEAWAPLQPHLLQYGALTLKSFLDGLANGGVERAICGYGFVDDETEAWLDHLHTSNGERVEPAGFATLLKSCGLLEQAPNVIDLQSFQQALQAAWNNRNDAQRSEEVAGTFASLSLSAVMMRRDETRPQYPGYIGAFEIDLVSRKAREISINVLHSPWTPNYQRG